MSSFPRIAIVHEKLVRLGGAERVVKMLSDLFPEAPIYTTLYDEKVCGRDFPSQKIRVSPLQKWWKFFGKRDKFFLPFFPRAVESWDFSEYDIILSSSSAFVHGILVPLETKHICYCHSPMRYAWDYSNEYLDSYPPFFRILIRSFLKKIRMWDQLASLRPDRYVANSKIVSERITKYYRRESEVLFPPVDIDRFSSEKKRHSFFLVLSALQSFKRIDMVIDAFKKNGLPLVIAGTGTEENALKKRAEGAKNITFLGRVSDEKARDLLETCQAFLFPGEDDFGITPVEAMASGAPVIAFGKGGVLETVLPKETGIFFDEQSPESLQSALDDFETISFDPKKGRKRAEEFSQKIFQDKILSYVQE